MQTPQTHTLHGSCRCGTVTFEADVDLSRGPSKSTSRGCWWSVVVKPEHFRPLAGDSLRDPVRSCCSRCGVIPYRKIEAAEWNDGAYYAVNVAALEDLDPCSLIAVTVRICEGRNLNCGVSMRTRMAS